MDELQAFSEEAAACEATLHAVPEDGWERPALGSWSVRELASHLVRAVTRIDAYLDEPVDDAAALIDRAEYFRYDHAAMAPAVAARAVADAAGVDGPALVAAFAAGWRRSAERAARHGADRPIATIRGPMRLDEYASTRVLELVVHHLDLRRALDLPPAPTPRAARLTADLLEALLDGPRPRAMGRDRFLLAATGRIAVDDERFPVLR